LGVLAVASPAAWAIAQATSLAIAGESSSSSSSVKPVEAPVAIKAGSATRAVGRPTWNELSPSQQAALKPLASGWDTLSVAQKRKWQALSKNFPDMPLIEQQRLHSRMSDWVSLSPQQRAQARLNFAETKALSPVEKNAKWEAYQALSPEEKKKLASSSAHSKPVGAATAVKPVPAQKLATAAAPKTTASGAKNSVPHHARIAVAPHQVDHNTLLPQASAPTRTP